MKTLAQHMNEALKIGKNLSSFSTYSCQPKTKKELIDIIRLRISKEGNNCDLNDIDTSLITDISWLFDESDFNGDISEWNVSKVENINRAFYKSKFNGDISKWDVSNVKYMWSVFSESAFNHDISKWNTSKVTDMSYMFSDSNFNQDISNWKINKDCMKYMVYNMFAGCPIKEEYKPKGIV